MSAHCLVHRLGTIPYQQAWDLQEQLAIRIAEETYPPVLLLLEHPHIFTFGRRGEAVNLIWDAQELERRGVQTLWVDRGGDVTYHGPGQLVGYPLLPLTPGGIYAGTNSTGSTSFQSSLPKVDYIGYIRKLEQVLIKALAGLGVAAIRLEGKTGVWLPPEPSAIDTLPAKIASIGVKVDARGISRHGFALNVDPDMSYWEGIVACGLAGHPAASLAGILHPSPAISVVEQAVIDSFAIVFGYQMVEANLEDLPVGGNEP